MERTFDIGQLVGACLWALPLLYFLYRADRAKTLSLILANLCLCCGFGAALTGSLLLLTSLARTPLMWTAVGLVCLAGMSLGIAALVVRRRDQGTGIARPTIGLVISAFFSMGSVGGLLLPVLVDRRPARPARPAPTVPLEEPGTSAWVYSSPGDSFRLRLSSSSWKMISSDSKQATFSHSPHMELAVEFGQRRSEADFEATAKRLTSSIDGNLKVAASAQHRQGTNASGCRYAYSTSTARDDQDNPVFVADCVTWCLDQQFTVDGSFGTLVHLSFAGAHADMQLLARTAEYILLSVEDGPM
jgi:hypothetical protein